VTWKLFQGVVKPTQSLAKGQCHIKLDGAEVKKDDSLVEPNYDSDGETNVVVAPSVVAAATPAESAESTEPSGEPPAEHAEPEKPLKKVVKKKGTI
jgi:hypothetical protein